MSTFKIVSASISSATLGILFNAVAVLFGAAWGRKSIALGGAIALAIAGFLFYSLAPLVDTFDRITPMNPFQWTLGSNPLSNGLDSGYTVIALSAALALYLIALFIYNRRDISA